MGVYVLWNLGVYGDVIPLKNFDCLSLINFRIQFIVCMLQNVDVWTGAHKHISKLYFDEPVRRRWSYIST